MQRLKNLFSRFFNRSTKVPPPERFPEKPVVHEDTKLPRPYVGELLDSALSITGKFEGSGFNSVSGNFDGQGISAGILQWCYGQESLQNKILRPAIVKLGIEGVDSFFPSPISHSAKMTGKQAVSFAKSLMLDGTAVKYNWRSAWERFLTSPALIEIQRQACDSVASKAWYYCEKFDMKTERAFCWFFDIVTQNGSLNGIPKPELYLAQVHYPGSIEREGGINKYNWQQEGVKDDEAKILFRWTLQRVVRNKWADDVISRKGTIAHCYGKVHGTLFDLRDRLLNTTDKI